MSVWCLFGHTDEVIDMQTLIERVPACQQQNRVFTIVTYQCETCGRLAQKKLLGLLDVSPESLNKR